ncbi:MAG: TetR/AcrR family transcriptional regulator [Chloroflexales bacterium]|nr:TetR/AcrR family transcriptional regulator [Chloroflexales bacterium]
MARDGAQTAERILQVAHQLFMERGFNGVSIKDVVQQVGISKPTLYYHYANKEALYVAMAHQVLTQMGAEMSAAIAEIDGSFAQLLCGVIEMIQSRNAEDTRMLRHEIRTYLSPQWQAQLAEQFYRTMMGPLVAVMGQGLANKQIAGGTAAELAMMFLCFVEAFSGPEGAAIQMHIDATRMTDLFLYGVSYQKEQHHGSDFTKLA